MLGYYLSGTNPPKQKVTIKPAKKKPRPRTSTADQWKNVVRVGGGDFEPIRKKKTVLYSASVVCNRYAFCKPAFPEVERLFQSGYKISYKNSGSLTDYNYEIRITGKVSESQNLTQLKNKIDSILDSAYTINTSKINVAKDGDFEVSTVAASRNVANKPKQQKRESSTSAPLINVDVNTPNVKDTALNFIDSWSKTQLILAAGGTVGGILILKFLLTD